MIEKMCPKRYRPGKSAQHQGYYSGYFKPKGKYQKRAIHKLLRKMKGTYKQGIMNRIGVPMEWS